MRQVPFRLRSFFTQLSFVVEFASKSDIGKPAIVATAI